MNRACAILLSGMEGHACMGHIGTYGLCAACRQTAAAVASSWALDEER